jgi:hypothetical protein
MVACYNDSKSLVNFKMKTLITYSGMIAEDKPELKSFLKESVS